MLRGNGLSTMTTVPTQGHTNPSNYLQKRKLNRKDNEGDYKGPKKGPSNGKINGDGRRNKPKKPYVHQPGTKTNGPLANVPSSGPLIAPVNGSNGAKLGPKTVMYQSYLAQEKEITGPLVVDPIGLGFKQRQDVGLIVPRALPKYMIQQSRLLKTPPFVQDPWDKQNQDRMILMEKEMNGKDFQGLYEEFQKMREFERRQMENLGLVDAENTSKDLTDAIHFKGTCLDMCPVFERVRRALENNVKTLEKDPVTNKISRDRAIKAFSRPAAGQPPPLPSDVRPPHILYKTLNHLIENLVPQLPEAHSFIWDRTRSIRQDFTYQNSFGPEAIDCNERIVRIHLCCLHILAGSDVEYSQQQELEQFNKALQTLLEIYKDIRNHGGEAPNEAEFRAYYLLSHIRDPEPERELQELPRHILQDLNVQMALMLRGMVLQSNIVERGYENTVGSLAMFLEFFKLVYSKQVPVLMGFLLETHFNEIRFYALKSMSRGYHSKALAMPCGKLQELLGFDSVDPLIKFVQYYEVDVVPSGVPPNNFLAVDLFNKDKLEHYKLNSLHDKPKLGPPYSPQFDENFDINNLLALINSGKPNGNLKLGSMNMIRGKSALDLAVFTSQLGTGTVSNSSIGFSSPQTLVSNNPVANSNIGKIGGQSPNASFLGSLAQNTFSLGSLGSTQFDFTKAAIPLDVNLEIPKPKINFGSAASNVPLGGVADTGKPPSSYSFTKNGAPSSFPSATTTTATTSAAGAGESLFQKVPSIPVNSLLSTQKDSIPLSSEPKRVLQFTKPEVAKIQPISASFGVPKFGAESLQPTVASKKIEHVTELQSTTIINPVSPPKLVDSKYYKDASREVSSSILSLFVDQELRAFLPRILEKLNRETKQKRMISDACSSIFDKMIHDQVKYKAMEIYAETRYATSLKRSCIRRIINTGLKSIEKLKLKKRKQVELELVDFDHKVARKRHKVIHHLENSNKIEKMINKNDPIAYIDDKKRAVEDLWKPLDIASFTDKLSSKMKVSIELRDIELLFLLAIEDWSSDCSKWLNSKLLLKADLQKMIYYNVHVTDRLKLNFSSLPSDYQNREYFTKVPFVLLEIGLPSGKGDLQSKLQSDKQKIEKITQLLTTYSLYQVQIALIYWDLKNEKLDLKTLVSSIGLDGILQNEVISGVKICDMTLELENDPIHLADSKIQYIEGNSISDRIGNLFNKLANDYNGQYSARGQRKLKKYKQQLLRQQQAKLQLAAEASSSSQRVKNQEIELLRKARELRKYKYLSRHVAGGSSNNTMVGMNTSNMSISNSNRTMSMRQPYSYNVGNNTNINYINQFTTMNETTMMANISILGGFGQGIVQESTPFSSPKKPVAIPTSMASVPSTPAISNPVNPKPTSSLQELLKLTLAVKSKYTRS